MIPAASTATRVTSASPIISAAAVEAVRCGLRAVLRAMRFIASAARRGTRGQSGSQARTARRSHREDDQEEERVEHGAEHERADPLPVAGPEGAVAQQPVRQRAERPDEIETATTARPSGLTMQRAGARAATRTGRRRGRSAARRRPSRAAPAPCSRDEERHERREAERRQRSEPTARKRANRPAGSVAPSRTAAIGGTRVARSAGRRLASSVTRMPTRSETTIVLRLETQAAVRQREPDQVEELEQPLREAETEEQPGDRGEHARSTSDSSITSRSTCRREAPSVRRVANSRVRCAIVIESELAITKAPTKRAMPANASRKRLQEADELVDVGGVLGRLFGADADLRAGGRIGWTAASSCTAGTPGFAATGSRRVCPACRRGAAPSAGRSPRASRRRSSRPSRT